MGLSSCPVSWKGQQQETTPILCSILQTRSMQNTAKVSYLQHETLGML
jgi:hypothetical protein